MVTDFDIAVLIQAQYDNRVDSFDIFMHTAGIDWAIKTFDDCTALFFEGSHVLPDFVRDFDFPMEWVPAIGGVHGGFYDGLPAAMEAIIPHLPAMKTIKICGHSLGAGEAHIMTAMLAHRGYHMLETITFGSPLPGDRFLADSLAPYPNRSYWNYRDFFNHDIVGSVPPYMPPIEGFVIPRDRILIDIPPPILDPWGLVAWHHFELYVKGLSNG